MYQTLKTITVSALLAGASWVSYAQTQPTDAKLLMSAIATRQAMSEESPLKTYPVRSIGPVVQGARITELAVDEENPKHYYVAYASGGVFETKNNGATFTPIFDHVGALTIGAITLAPSNNEVLYVGTGENNSSRSSYAGSGVYKSTDGGSSWQHLGLEATQHIGRIAVHPTDPNTVWVASVGALYSHNEARGVYKSTDGGSTWRKTLYINDSTGIIDLAVDPKNPQNLLAAAWERTRRAWDFKGNGPGSAIYRSTDGGENWTRVTTGFPQDDKVGRIGLSYHRQDPSIVYAVMDYQKELPNEEEDEASEDLEFKNFLNMSIDDFNALPDEKLETFLENNGFPSKYTVAIVREDIAKGKYSLEDIANYSGDANAALFNTNVAGASVYKSTDGGATWEEVSGSPIAGVFFTYGYYFAQIRVSPTDPDRLFVMGVPVITSADGGKTWSHSDTSGRVHVDHHEIWINPKDDQHVLLGNDGGLYSSYDGGNTWNHINNTSTGQFYTVSVDMAKPYNVYGGLQDNGSVFGSSRSVPNQTKKWETVFGGDGMYIFNDPKEPSVVYTGFQFGNYFRLDRAGGSLRRITPNHDIGEPVLRFNWRTPVVMSAHNSDIIYFGAQRVYRSLDRGDTWQPISEDLTRDLPQGNVPHSTITWISESPATFGVLYVGTDDGKVWVTQNGGATWQDISKGLPEELWVSSVVASPHKEGAVFVTLNGYRFDDFKSYVFASEDYGKTWTSLTNNLPQETANVILQDPENANLLYLGTDGGTYLSMNAGARWELLPGLPNVASYDMVVHPRDLELVIATHGRSMYVADVKPLQKIAGSITSLTLFGSPKIRHRDNWGEKRYLFSEPNLPKASVSFYSAQAGDLLIEVLNEEEQVVHQETVAIAAGFGSYTWNVKVDVLNRRGRSTGKQEFAGKGTYTLRASISGESQSTEVVIE